MEEDLEILEEASLQVSRVLFIIILSTILLSLFSSFLLTSSRCVSPTQGFWGRVWPCLTPPQSSRPWREICPFTSKLMSTLSLRTSSPVSRTQVEDVWRGTCPSMWPSRTALSCQLNLSDNHTMHL